jgi:hypothetical protein
MRQTHECERSGRRGQRLQWIGRRALFCEGPGRINRPLDLSVLFDFLFLLSQVHSIPFFSSCVWERFVFPLLGAAFLIDPVLRFRIIFS